jgi:SAM-dependent methyltransferase
MGDSSGPNVRETVESLRSREEWERWYAKPDPWETEGSDTDRVRTEAILERLKHAHFVNFLDLGCGEGRLTKALSMHCQNTYAFDIEENALERARSRYQNVEFRQGDLLDVIVLPEIVRIPFDLISVSEVLYYLQTDEERNAAISGLARIGTLACLYYFSAIVTGASKYRRYFTYDSFLQLLSGHFNVIDTFPSVANVPRWLGLLRYLWPSEPRTLAVLRAWTATRRPEDGRHVGCFALKREAGSSATLK